MKYLKYSLLASMIPLMVACDNNGSSTSVDEQLTSDNAQFSVSMVNLTNNQPLSPVAVIAHSTGYHAFVDGETAGIELETLAEGGDNSQLLSSAQSNQYYLASASGSGPVPPQAAGETLTFSVPSDQLTDLRVTLLTMLVNTNDAFTGLNAADLSNMAIGDVKQWNAPSWDSGTEGNTEASGTIPGPADTSPNKVGFDAARSDDIDRVRFHAGVVTSADGLSSSVLDESHRFDNPTMRVSISRTQ